MPGTELAGRMIMSQIYHTLSRSPLGRHSYLRKFLVVAFIGIHVPLLVLILLLGFDLVEPFNTSLIVGILLATLVATAVTLYVLRELLWPLRHGTAVLRQYFEDGVLPPTLPTGYDDEAGQLLQLIEASITRSKKREEEQQFLTTLLSHDLRSPAAQTVTAARYIQDEKDLNNIHQLAKLMEQSGQQMLEQMTNLVTLFRAGEKEQSEVQSLDFAALAQVSVEQARAIADVKGVGLQLEGELPSDAFCKGQTVLLQQAMYNLLTNAIKFSNPGEQIRVWLTATNGHCQMTVKDEGIGFEPEKAESLFTRFTREGRKGTHGEASSGIGLYLVRTIARRFGGEAFAHSEGAGKGATFSLRLPLRDEQNDSWDKRYADLVAKN